MDAGDEFSDDDLFDQVTENDILQLTGEKRARGNGEEASENPTKKPRPASNTLVQPPLFDESKAQLAQKLLVEKFQYKDFRHEQKSAINRILCGKNTLVIFPTGAGKSLCYQASIDQIPAIAFEDIDRQNEQRASGQSGITIVVSPLIALMKDQVDVLKKKGIAAELLVSSNDWSETKQIYDSIRQGTLRILYCAPERLNNEGFVESMTRVKGGVRLVAVDEAHCISEWGHSFRPDYLKVARFVQEINAERVICLTATATPKVADDVCKAFNITADGVFRTSPYRPNLRLEATPLASEAEKRKLLFEFLETHPGSSLIYVTQQKQAEDLARVLQQKNLSADYFHAGRKPDEKKLVQDKFMASKVRIIVATIAFGMGIDKSDLRNVIHWDLPNTVEEYCQQVGRAGRDGKQSCCMLYLCPNDCKIKESFIRGDMPSRHSVQSLLEEIFVDKREAVPGDTFKVSHASQSSEFDIRQSTLGNIYATLELRFNLIRAITPEYNTYKFEETPSYLSTLKANKSVEAKAVLQFAKKAKKYYGIDLKAATNATGASRNDIVRLLNDLSNSGVIQLTVGGVEQKYKVLSRLPHTATEIDNLVGKVYQDLEKREKQALDRVQGVLDFLASPTCFARFIAEHFGMSLPDGKKSCGHCTPCYTGTSMHLPTPKPKTVDEKQIRAVLAATKIRDDPLFLARVAFGISSPRATKSKLSKHPIFGSMADDNFEMILKEFEKACK
ncbi:unnamed protein product [Clonostachys chloroleuca]|uniref:DNA 3'-5' helicase n=1 Tax=Clonostachys chloroleuca TaxID=1926264 RepID=A0AA35M6T7_9HYPO|nr:unnamed protein product [Clonostachys chloroleuca]